MMTPTLGRIVLFRDPDGGAQMAAIVTAVNESGVLKVCGFDPVMGPRNFPTTGEGDGPGQWQWPPRVAEDEDEDEDEDAEAEIKPAPKKATAKKKK